MTEPAAHVDIHVRTKGSRWGILAARLSRFMPERAERALLAWSLRRLKVQVRIGRGKWRSIPADVWWEGDTLMCGTPGSDPVAVGSKEVEPTR